MVRKSKYRKTFSKINSKYPIIVLTHNPDTVKHISNNKTDLILAGHTHGNTFRFFTIPLCPFIRNIKLSSKFLKVFKIIIIKKYIYHPE